MDSCREEVTTEEYIAHFDAELKPNYPREISYGGDVYLIYAKEFSYNKKQFLRVEIWDEKNEKIMVMASLVKSGKCRYHSPINPNFDISSDIVGTETGRQLLAAFMDVIRTFCFSFIIEEIYGDEVGFDRLKKEYDKAKYKTLSDFYKSAGFELFFNKLKGKGYIVIKGEPLNAEELKCFSTIASALTA